MLDKEKFNIEQFNVHQEDTRRRADSFCRAIFLLSGGMLTISIGIFSSGAAPFLSENMSMLLKVSWWGLFASILFLSLSLTIIIMRDYALGERWRKLLNGKLKEIKDVIPWVEYLIWITAIVGLIGFLLGIFGHALVVSSLLGELE